MHLEGALPPQGWPGRGGAAHDPGPRDSQLDAAPGGATIGPYVAEDWVDARWRKQRVLGRGSFSVVWKVEPVGTLPAVHHAL